MQELIVFPCSQLCLHEPRHELVLSSVVVACVRRARVTFSLGRWVEMEMLGRTRRNDKGSCRAVSAPGKSQPAIAICCLAPLNIS